MALPSVLSRVTLVVVAHENTFHLLVHSVYPRSVL